MAKTNTRTARTPGDEEPKYVIANGAPPHYVDGYGLVGPGAIVTLAPGVEPGRWYMEVAPEDAAKAATDQAAAQRLAALAAVQVGERAREQDLSRKRAFDQLASQKQQEEAEANAQRESEAIARASAAEAKERKAQDDLTAEREGRKALEAELEATRAELAKFQQQAQAAKPADNKQK